MTRLVIVDDDLVQLERLKIILAGEKDISIAGVYSDPREALRNLVTDRPNIILTDICMPLIDGAAFISQSRKILPKADFIALTCMDDDETIDKVFSSGASGYLLKSESPARLCEVLRKYHKGEPPLSSKVVSHLVERMREKTVRAAPSLPTGSGGYSWTPGKATRTRRRRAAWG